MKISYRWLKEHIALDVPAEGLGGHLLSLGFELAGLEKTGPQFSGVVAAEILEIARHPNADRLSLCKVNDGSAVLSIVCGAKNIAVGQRVPLARIGAALPGGHKIARSKIRGVESEGMICSGSELGLGADAGGGIKVLEAATPLGADLSKTLGESDEILDVEITPNRPDCLSHFGLARELSAYFRIPLKTRPEAQLPADRGRSFDVEVQDPSACPRYLGRLIEGVRVGPSPGWLAARLTALGLRPINNVVDVTNFILLDLGQPLHAFDADKLEGSRIVVRWAAAGESLKALDGKLYALGPSHLVIADAKRPAAIAGIMGGEATGTTEQTKRVFLESAYFHPPAIRRASSELRLRSDSSQRFERGCDRGAVASAARRALELIAAASGGAAFAEPSEFHAPEERPAPIVTTSQRLNEILGADFKDSQIDGCLSQIGALSRSGPHLSFAAPSHRHDLASPWDLAEEAGRLLGYGNIPTRVPAVAAKPRRPVAGPLVAERCRARLAAAGMSEAYSFDFISKALYARARQSAPAAELANPLNEDWTLLRPTLLVGLLQSAALNLNRGAEAVRLFELGKVYARGDREVLESARVSGLLCGPKREAHWQGKSAPSDFFEAKGLVEDLAAGLAGLSWRAPEGDTELFHPRQVLDAFLPEGRLGRVGTLHPQAARAWDLSGQPVALFELDLELVAGQELIQARYSEISAFPSSGRDISFFAPQGISYAAVEAAIAACRIPTLREVELIDLFTGPGVPEGKKSLTLRLTFGSDERTLTDIEVNAAFDKIAAELSRAVSAALRA